LRPEPVVLCGGSNSSTWVKPMATVHISFDGGNVPIVTGDAPPSDRTPIIDPTPTGFTTNQAFIVAEGFYCFGLQSPIPYTPLWQVVQAVDGVQAEIAFRKLP
jgi:hypothetical protein